VGLIFLGEKTEMPHSPKFLPQFLPFQASSGRVSVNENLPGDFSYFSAG